MKTHPAAELFPMLGNAELAELANDIKENGLIVPIAICDGMIIDGRNRLKACEMAGVTPRYAETDIDDPYAWVWSINGERRHFSSHEQKYGVKKACDRFSSELKRKKQDVKADANKARSAKAQGNKNASKNSSCTSCTTSVSGTAKTREHAAKEAGVNKGAVARFDALERKSPELAEKVVKGEMPFNAAMREAKRAEIVANLESVEVREAKAISGVYDVIVIDPPWPMQKIERDVAPEQVAFDYPTMTESELSDMTIPADKDCHMWLWTTHKFLPMALRLLESWSFKYICTFVWHKNGGFQPFGLPQFNCEFAIYAHKGNPQFVDTKAFNVCFNAPRKKHSEKPEEFYDVIRRVTAGRRLDMFNRRAIDGFDVWGKEAAQ